MNKETSKRVERRKDLKLFNITLYRALNFLHNDLNIFKIKNKKHCYNCISGRIIY